MINILKDNFRSTILRYGLIGGIVALYLAAVGMIETFLPRLLVGTSLSLGHVFLLAAAIGAGFFTARELKEHNIGVTASAGFVAGAIASGYPWPVVAVPALLMGMFIVDAFVNLRGNMMSNRFMRQLPDGLDTIIRGIRSGIPVIECIGAVGQEFEAPMGEHFQRISESVKLGEPLEMGLWRVARVVRRPEMDFLTIAISIQMETGGSLSDALGNLAALLRQRANMKLKIKAISSEAKASALIIGALPFVMLALLTFMNPDYVMPLFTDPRGQMMLMMGLGSITMGAIVMWRMTQFEI